MGINNSFMVQTDTLMYTYTAGVKHSVSLGPVDLFGVFICYRAELARKRSPLALHN